MELVADNGEQSNEKKLTVMEIRAGTMEAIQKEGAHCVPRLVAGSHLKRRLDSLVEVLNDIADIFDAERDANQIVRRAVLEKIVFRELTLNSPLRTRDKSTDICGENEWTRSGTSAEASGADPPPRNH